MYPEELVENFQIETLHFSTIDHNSRIKPRLSACRNLSANAVVVLQSLSAALSSALGSHSCMFLILLSFCVSC